MYDIDNRLTCTKNSDTMLSWLEKPCITKHVQEYETSKFLFRFDIVVSKIRAVIVSWLIY